MLSIEGSAASYLSAALSICFSRNVRKELVLTSGSGLFRIVGFETPNTHFTDHKLYGLGVYGPKKGKVVTIRPSSLRPAWNMADDLSGRHCEM